MKWEKYHTVWAIMIFGWVTNYMVRASLSPLLIPILQEFKLTYAQGGILATAFFYAYTFMQLPAGHLGDRLGRKVVLVLCTSWWGLMSLLTGLAHSFTALFVFRFLTGVGEGAYFSNDRPIISAYTPERKRGLGQGISFIGLGTGMFIGISLAGWISELWGWRSVFVLYAFPSFLASFLIYRLVKEPPSAKKDKDKVEVKTNKKPSYSLIFKSRDLWLLYLGGIPAIYALWVVGTWAPAIFKEMGVESLARSSFYSSLLGISAIPGLSLTGLVSDRLARRGKGRKGLIAIEFFLISFCMLALGYGLKAKINIYLFVFLFFMAGFFIWGHWAAFYSLLPDIVPYEILGTTYGLTNTIHFLGSLIAPWATGWIKDVTASFSWGLYLAAVFCVAGGILVFAVRPSFSFGKERAIFEA
jgi:ACS family glucarate transporter-like MFS transporter